jgi:hypothetical protein
MSDMLTRQHERWDEFATRLETTMLLGKTWEQYVAEAKRDAGAQFAEEQEAELWLRAFSSACNGHGPGHSHEATLAILSSMGMDVPASMAYLAERGGCCCDCEVMLNVIAGGAEEEDEEEAQQRNTCRTRVS